MPKFSSNIDTINAPINSKFHASNIKPSSSVILYQGRRSPTPVTQTPPAVYAGLKVKRESSSEDLGDNNPPTGSRGRASGEDLGQSPLQKLMIKQTKECQLLGG